MILWNGTTGDLPVKKLVQLETPQLELHLLGQMIASPLFGWLYQKTGSARLVGLITSVAYIVGNILYSILSVFPEDYRYGLLLFSRFIVGVSSGIYFIYSFLFIKVQTLWEGHQIWKNLPLVLTKQLFLLSSVKTSGRFFQKFLAFSKSWTLKFGLKSWDVDIL